MVSPWSENKPLSSVYLFPLVTYKYVHQYTHIYMHVCVFLCLLNFSQDMDLHLMFIFSGWSTVAHCWPTTNSNIFFLYFVYTTRKHYLDNIFFSPQNTLILVMWFVFWRGLLDFTINIQLWVRGMFSLAVQDAVQYYSEGCKRHGSSLSQQQPSSH